MTDERRDLNGWPEYRLMVLSELERLNRQFDVHNTSMMTISDRIHTQLSEIQREIAILKVKSGVWGASAGAITVLVTLGIGYVLR